MSELITEIWRTSIQDDRNFSVLPDGCQDVIVEQLQNGRIQWHISPLQSSVMNVQLKAGSQMTGFCLAPGVEIDEEILKYALSAKFRKADRDPVEFVPELLADCCGLLPQTRVLLSCLSEKSITASAAANELGVSLRTMQRLAIRTTGQSPLFWLRLARIRKAARAIAQGGSLSEICYDLGFSDQAHMTREFRLWLGATPTTFIKCPDLTGQLHNIAYC